MRRNGRAELVQSRGLTTGLARLANPQIGVPKVEAIPIRILDLLTSAGPGQDTGHGLHLADKLRGGEPDIIAPLPVLVQEPAERPTGRGKPGESLSVDLCEDAGSVGYRDADKVGFRNVRRRFFLNDWWALRSS